MSRTSVALRDDILEAITKRLTPLSPQEAYKVLVTTYGGLLYELSKPAVSPTKFIMDVLEAAISRENFELTGRME